MPRVTVYGTLREGGGNHKHHLSGAKKISTGKMQGYLLINLGGFPCAVPANNKEWKVAAETYEIDAMTLVALDQLEGVASNFYRRDILTHDDGSRSFVYVYHPKSMTNLMAREKSLSLMLNGDWNSKDDIMDVGVEEVMDMLCPTYINNMRSSYDLVQARNHSYGSVELKPARKVEPAQCLVAHVVA